MYRFLSILSILVIISTIPFVSSEVIRGESTVPDWVKNTAGWWASEQIDDSAFLQGIQYLIKEEIIVVEIPTEIDSEDIRKKFLVGLKILSAGGLKIKFMTLHLFREYNTS